MALLYRFTRLKDRSNTGVFTFIVTRSVTRDFHRDATTKEFSYGYHRWAVSFTRTEKMLGVYLLLRSPAQGTKCYVDFSFSLLNREHFSKNEAFAEKQSRFTAEQPAQGLAKWVLMGDLRTRRFTDENGEFIMELALANLLTVYESEMKVPSLSPFLSSQSKTGGGNRAETGPFPFGSYEWNLSVTTDKSPLIKEHGHGPKHHLGHHCHHADDGPTTPGHLLPRVLLNRMTGFGHPCRVQYRVVLGEGEKRADSSLLDQISDGNGRIRGFSLRCNLTDLTRRGKVRVYVEMHCANTISEVEVATKSEPSTVANCYDRDKQGWCVEGDVEGECLRLKLFYPDIHAVPRNHLRYVSWNAYVVRRDPDTGNRESLLVLDNPHNNYYVQDGVDMGVIMETSIPVSEVLSLTSPYLFGGQLTVHVEWLDSLLLFGAVYHKYDDVPRIHAHQMRREICALQSENFSLERQLVSYQKSISFASSRGQTATGDGGLNLDTSMFPQQPQHQLYYQRPPPLSDGQQSFSESEYS